MRRILALVALAAFLAPSTQAGGPLAFPAIDTNHDGFVTWDEARRKMTKLANVHFDKCDPSRDGLIDRGEYPLLATFYWQNYIMQD